MWCLLPGLAGVGGGVSLWRGYLAGVLFSCCLKLSFNALRYEFIIYCFVLIVAVHVSGGVI